MLVRMWKAVRVMFMCIFPDKELSKLNAENAEEFSFHSSVNKESPDGTSLRDNATS